jgi:hypothetical protein
LYSSSDIIKWIKSRRMRWEGHEVRTGEMIYSYIILVGEPERKRPLGRRRGKQEDNVRLELRETVWRSEMDSSGSG